MIMFNHTTGIQNVYELFLTTSDLPKGHYMTNEGLCQVLSQQHLNMYLTNYYFKHPNLKVFHTNNKFSN